jgi:hypothetical protein
MSEGSTHITRFDDAQRSSSWFASERCSTLGAPRRKLRSPCGVHTLPQFHPCPRRRVRPVRRSILVGLKVTACP